MEPRGQPSGGDWALERLGVLLLEGTEDVAVSECLFTRIDGNAIFLSGYNRRAVVARNEFVWLGQNAVASWGRTDEWDGTGGQQPRHTTLYGNLAHEIGNYQKQSSFYFQAASCENTLDSNIVYNIPRAAIKCVGTFWGGGVKGFRRSAPPASHTHTHDARTHTSLNFFPPLFSVLMTGLGGRTS
jgi:hypothetical protein